MGAVGFGVVSGRADGAEGIGNGARLHPVDGFEAGAHGAKGGLQVPRETTVSPSM